MPTRHGSPRPPASHKTRTPDPTPERLPEMPADGICRHPHRGGRILIVDEGPTEETFAEAIPKCQSCARPYALPVIERPPRQSEVAPAADPAAKNEQPPPADEAEERNRVEYSLYCATFITREERRVLDHLDADMLPTETLALHPAHRNQARLKALLTRQWPYPEPAWLHAIIEAQSALF